MTDTDPPFERNPRRVLVVDVPRWDEAGRFSIRRSIVLEDVDTGQLWASTVEAWPTVPTC